MFKPLGLGTANLGGALTAVAAEALVDSEGLSLTHVLGVRGAGQLSGELGFKFKGQGLSGMLTASGVNISDFYEGPVVGVVDLKDVALGWHANGSKDHRTCRSPYAPCRYSKTDKRIRWRHSRRL